MTVGLILLFQATAGYKMQFSFLVELVHLLGPEALKIFGLNFVSS